jgi:serine protease Do
MKRVFQIMALLSFLPTSGRAVNASLVQAQDDFSAVAAQVNPCVVNVSTSQTLRQQVPDIWSYYFGENFFNQGRELRRQSLGSGIILSADGKILTNAHVVSGADEISVGLDNGDSYPATVLGEDEGVDLAVLKIQPKFALSPAKLGDSASVKVGQWAIAIGNPFGFDHSLTVGVISA